ncbi:MAG: SgcJ/EcaC family oxidoreductase [Bacteroidia bacterium]
MKRIFTSAVILSLIMASQSKPNQSSTLNQKTEMETIINTEKAAIENMLFAYRDALNASDVSKVLPLYTEDGVFMPSSAPTSVGQEQVKGAYEFVFSNIQLNIEFYIDEIVVNGDFALARTTSKGTTLIHATGETVPEENRELFVLQKTSGSWKIARYMFNKMK